MGTLIDVIIMQRGAAASVFKDGQSSMDTQVAHSYTFMLLKNNFDSALVEFELVVPFENSRTEMKNIFFCSVDILRPCL